MHFVDELSVHFLKVVETAATGYSEKQKTIKFFKDIVIDSPGVIPVTSN